MLKPVFTVLLALSAGMILVNSPWSHAAGNNFQQVVNNPQRPENDKLRDHGRKPVQLLQFMQVKPGMIVFEQGAGGGYTTEILAHAVGPEGRVFAEGLDPLRLKDNRLRQVKPLERGLIYQIPERAKRAGLSNGQADLVVMMFTYHDLTLNDRIDRAAMLGNMKNLLKSGGHIIMADNAAIEGSGLSYTPQLHRIDKQLVIKEFSDAGFVLVEDSDLYANPKDNLKAHWRFLSKPRNHHRMLLKFKKP